MEMAPVCAACHLSMGSLCVFVICLLLLTLKVISLIVYDRQTLLDLCVFTKNLAKCTSVSDKSTMLPKSLRLFAGSRIYFVGVFFTTAGKHDGNLVKIKAKVFFFIHGSIV